jgi:hypothetical protein
MFTDLAIEATSEAAEAAHRVQGPITQHRQIEGVAVEGDEPWPEVGDAGYERRYQLGLLTINVGGH